MQVTLNGSSAADAALQNAAVANGNGSTIDVSGQSSLFIQISGTFVGTINFEATQDNLNYVGILGQNINSGAQVTNATTAGIFSFPVNGLKTFRARISGYTSGSITVKATALATPLAALSSATINATVDAVKIKDATGTNTWSIDSSGQGPVVHKAYNGATYDDWRNNTQGTLLASAARTAGVASPNQTNYNARGVLIFVDVSAITGTGIKLHIRGFSPVTGTRTWMNTTPAAITATGIYIYEMYPGATGAGADVTQRTSGTIGRTWGVEVEHTDASSVTYSVGYELNL